MLVTQLVFICGLVLMASASKSGAGIINGPNVATFTEVAAAAVTISDDLKEKLSSDPAFRSFCKGLGFFSQRIPEEHREIYSKLGRTACTVILNSKPIPKGIGMRSLPEAHNIAHQNDTPFLLVSHRYFAIYFFYQDSILRALFRKDGQNITAGQASCNLKGFTKEMTMAYENGTSIIKHPRFELALEYLQTKYGLHPILVREAATLAVFGLTNTNFDIFVKTVSDNGQAEMVISGDPSISIGVHGDRIILRHVPSDKILWDMGRNPFELAKICFFLILLSLVWNCMM